MPVSFRPKGIANTIAEKFFGKLKDRSSSMKDNRYGSTAEQATAQLRSRGFK